MAIADPLPFCDVEKSTPPRTMDMIGKIIVLLSSLIGFFLRVNANLSPDANTTGTFFDSFFWHVFYLFVFIIT